LHDDLTSQGVHLRAARGLLHALQSGRGDKKFALNTAIPERSMLLAQRDRASDNRPPSSDDSPNDTNEFAAFSDREFPFAWRSDDIS
jgi:hypothetical protein